MNNSKVVELYDLLEYTLEIHEIHAWKLSVRDSRSIYYSVDYDKTIDFDDDIFKHLLQYGINQVVLIHENISNELEYFIIDSIFNTEEDENGEYFRLQRISESEAYN